MRISLEQAIDSVINVVENKVPFSLIRIGDGEIDVLSGKPCNYDLWVYPGNNHCRRDSTSFLVEKTRDATKSADILGIFEGDIWTYEILKKIGCSYEDKPEVYAFGNLHLVTRKNFVDEILRKRSLLLVGNSMKRWGNEILKLKIPESKFIVYEGTTLIYTKEDFNSVIDFIKENLDSFEIALISMGVWAGSIIAEIKKMGKIGIDFGHAPDHMLIGEYEINTQYESIDEYYSHSKCPTCLK